MANLESALEEVKRGNVRRWQNYVRDTRDLMMPYYNGYPELRAELETRLKAIDEAILEAQMGGEVGSFDCGDFVRES